MIQKIVHFFDKFEDRVRSHLSRYPILYTIIGGVAIVLFWRGVWHTADMLQARGGVWGFLFYEPTSLLLVTGVLLATGLFVSYFIGDAIILSGAKSQKKLAEKTDKELQEEVASLNDIKKAVESIQTEVHELKKDVAHDYYKLKKGMEHHNSHHITKEKEIEVKK